MHPFPTRAHLGNFILVCLMATGSAQEVPEITSSLELSGKRGSTIDYTIAATGDPVEFEAVTDGTSLSIENLDTDAGTFTIRILPDAPEDFAVISISATNEAMETGSADIVVTILPDDEPGAGLPRVMEAEIAIWRPLVIKADYELVSAFLFKAKTYTAQPAAETKPGTLVAGLRTERLTNKTVLEQMVRNDLIEDAADFSLLMIGPLDGEPELFAVNRKLGLIEPVPPEILGLVRGEKVGGFKEVTDNVEGEVVAAQAAGYLPLTVTWADGTGETMTLTGLGRYKSVLRFATIDEVRESYFAETLSGKVSGHNTGGAE